MSERLASVCGLICLVFALLLFRTQPVAGAFFLIAAAFTGLYAGLAR